MGAPSARWAWAGVVAGVSGIVANLVADDQATLSEAQRRSVEATLATVDRGSYHLGVAAGFAAVAGLVLLAAGWRRWQRTQVNPALAEEAVAPALLVSAAALLVAYGFRGGLAEYLPGGINDDNFPADGVYVLFIINDTAPWFGWWGVLLAAGLVAWASFTRRLVPVWLGVLSVVAVALPLLVMALTGAVAIAGLTGPVWLTVASVTVALRGLAESRAPEPAASIAP